MLHADEGELGHQRLSRDRSGPHVDAPESHGQIPFVVLCADVVAGGDLSNWSWRRVQLCPPDKGAVALPSQVEEDVISNREALHSLGVPPHRPVAKLKPTSQSRLGRWQTSCPSDEDPVRHDARVACRIARLPEPGWTHPQSCGPFMTRRGTAPRVPSCCSHFSCTARGADAPRFRELRTQCGPTGFDSSASRPRAGTNPQVDGGRTGIRTQERVAPLAVFKTVAFVRSATLPRSCYRRRSSPAPHCTRSPGRRKIRGRGATRSEARRPPHGGDPRGRRDAVPDPGRTGPGRGLRGHARAEPPDPLRQPTGRGSDGTAAGADHGRSFLVEEDRPPRGPAPGRRRVGACVRIRGAIPHRVPGDPRRRHRGVDPRPCGGPPRCGRDGPQLARGDVRHHGLEGCRGDPPGVRGAAPSPRGEHPRGDLRGSS